MVEKKPVETPAPELAKEDNQVDQTWFKPRLERERAKALKDAGFETAEEAKAAADALKAQKEAEKVTAQKLAEAQAVYSQLKGRSDSITALLTEQANESFNGLSEAEKAAVRLQTADDAPAEDRIKAIRTVKTLAAKLAEQATKTEAEKKLEAESKAVAEAKAKSDAEATNTAPGRKAPAGGAQSEDNHRKVWEDTREKNPWAAAQYAQLHPDAYKTT